MARNIMAWATVLIFVSHVQPFLTPGLLSLLAGAGNSTIFANSSSLVAALFTHHVNHTLSQIQTVAALAALVGGAGAGVGNGTAAGGLASQYLANLTAGLASTFANLTESKIDIGTQAAGTLFNAGSDLATLGAEAAALKPAALFSAANAFANGR